ncbi:glycosyltransferase family 2 protein [Vibrio agarivorans]|uniref:glycosyltransferase family 2 protein n=1 Tax=Vibrio agarivorans TaxID=153622 RepID=UPI0025B2C8C6|nr:glycosyltransferase [Vibrio agarivorans]MDN3660806.1 glycosyltransferase [Vibrio agarivorans]
MATHNSPANDRKISIIITSYNYEKFIRNSIDSVLAQDYPHVELIVVDDCSSDSSREIISSYADQLTSCFQEVNQGHGAAFNRGFAASSGDLVMFLDADDFLLPNALSTAIDAFQMDTSLCQYRMALVDEQGHRFDVFPKLEVEFDTQQRAENKLLHSGYYQTTVTSGLIYSRQYLTQVLPMPSEDFRQGGDGYLVSLAPLYGPVTSSEIELSGYRQHGANHSSFTNQLVKRAQWRIEHNQMRHKAIIKAAAQQQRVIDKHFYFNDVGLLSEFMCIKLFSESTSLFPQEPHTDLPDHKTTPSRTTIARQALRNLWQENISVANKLILAVWWLSIATLPKKAAQPIYSWKVLASSRPALISRLSKVLRRA